MRCPICGAKMVDKKLCPYCKVTDEQVYNASNKKVSSYRKADMSDLVHFTTVIPKDVSRVKLLLLTIFLGIVGANHCYVKRTIRFLYSLISTSVAMVIVALDLIVPTLRSIVVYNIFFELVVCALTFNIMFWIFDIINAVLGTFKIPVVLADKGENE